MRWGMGLPFHFPLGGTFAGFPLGPYLYPVVLDPPWMYRAIWNAGQQLEFGRQFLWNPVLGPWGSLELLVGPD